jgi:hypothetical protein
MFINDHDRPEVKVDECTIVALLNEQNESSGSN